ncbi:MAG: hypothetical protein L0287_05540 [Anaerolineae bacterium]|nr:hypothetical protein [Anaerolineae bacterium]
MHNFNELYRKHNERMEDFWSRRVNAPKFERTIHIFGHPVVFDSNHEKVLDSATFAEEMYSTSDLQKETTWRVHLTVRSTPDPSTALGLDTASQLDQQLLLRQAQHGGSGRSNPPPERLIDLIHYTGADDWLSIDLLEWGNCFVDMKRGEAYAVLSQSLAEKPEQVCQVLINTILTNFITRHGYSMLHASALIKDENILLLQAPHGTGKSTTALRLLLNGYRLLSDSQVYIGEYENELWMGGFPVGRIKLRADMLPLFPALAAEAEAEAVRNETKHRVELKRVDPALAYPHMIRIRRVEYCLLERWDKSESTIESLTEDELWTQIMVNSLHYDTPEIWNENLRRVDLLLKHANLHRLRFGTSEDEIIKTVNGLW